MSKADPLFVNDVAGFGCVNGVANISFLTLGFVPVVNDQGGVEPQVPPAAQISANLRMDLYCVQQLRDVCDKIIAQNTKPAVVQ